MKLTKKNDKYTIEGIAPIELDALYNAIVHSLLIHRRELYELKTLIEDEK